MSGPTEMAQRRQAALSELVELGMALARDQQARALAAETAEEAQALGAAFNQTARAVRLALALEVRLTRDLAREAREAARETRELTAAAVTRRKAQVKAALARPLDAAESMAAYVELCQALETEALYDRFLEGSVDTQIAALRARLGLPAPAAAAVLEARAEPYRPDAPATFPDQATPPTHWRNTG
jgi:hypothetical protein